MYIVRSYESSRPQENGEIYMHAHYEAHMRSRDLGSALRQSPVNRFKSQHAPTGIGVAVFLHRIFGAFRGRK